MEPNISQEILVFTDTTFARKQLAENYQAGPGAPDGLERACWSGLLFERLPGILNVQAKIMYVWKVSLADEFVHITAGNTPHSPEQETSIDPYFFTRSAYFNN